MSPRLSLLIASLLLLFCLGLKSTKAIEIHTVTNTIQPGQSLKFPKEIVSANGNFALGFFSPGNSAKYYVGIWFNNISQTVVWVANREYPFPQEGAVLTCNLNGTLVISDERTQSMVANTSAGNDTYAMLLDTGNLILTNGVEVFWQSFDVPTDSLLAGMNYEDSFRVISLASWRSQDDPSPGLFTMKLSYNYITLLKGSAEYYSTSWLEITSSLKFTSGISRVVLAVSGQLKLQSWSEDGKKWHSLQSFPGCGGLGDLCGAFSNCNEAADEPCGCLPGFANFSANGCVRRTSLQCSNNKNGEKDVFLQMSNVDWPSNPLQLNISGTECKSTCLENCSCTAYAYYSERKLLNCLLWNGSLLNLKQLPVNDRRGYDIYLKLAPSDLVTEDSNSSTPTVTDLGYKYSKNNQLLVILPTSLAILILCVSVYLLRRKLRRRGENLLQLDVGMNLNGDDSEFSDANKHGSSRKREVKMPLFSFASVSAATGNFSATNKLGEGGFGPVYKGILLNGDEVAVKRLSRRSGQGWEELKNEAMVIAKLQHKNLVRLLGCCIEREEKILVYEYMPNKSLDFFLFDLEKRRILDWETRVRVIEGVAQGLLYLHQYSRLRIIHRDLKASNILLDIDMNPKISDFGMARIFGGNESQANTNRIVGTYGYMSPEYALEGLFSFKSDVFSFGVLLLEIVSGRKNTGFYMTDSFHLLGYAWDLWTSNRGSDLMDPLLDDISSMDMVLRYVNIGLLCVQESAGDRPTMSDVVSILSNEAAVLPYPKQPGFLNVRSTVNTNPVNRTPEVCSMNQATVSIMEGR